MDKWLELDRYQYERDPLLLVFAALPRLVTTALKFVAPRPRGRVIVALDGDSNPIKSSNNSGVPASPYWSTCL